MTIIYKPSVSQFIADAIETSGRTQRQIAEIAGFNKANVISMLKTGQVKVPYDRIRSLARALRVDHVELARLTIGEYEPHLLTLLEELHVKV